MRLYGHGVPARLLVAARLRSVAQMATASDLRRCSIEGPQDRQDSKPLAGKRVGPAPTTTAGRRGARVALSDPTASPAQLRGRVLAGWREMAGFTLAEVAERLAVLLDERRAAGEPLPRRLKTPSKATISAWEIGGRKFDLFDRLDLEVFADRVLGVPGPAVGNFAGMWYGAAAVTLPAHTVASKNFPRPPGDVWVWIRTTASTTARLQWAMPLHEVIISPEFPGGQFVQFPVSWHQLQLNVNLDVPGWIVFGRGRVPQDVSVMGCAVLDGVVLFESAKRTWAAYALDSRLGTDSERQALIVAESLRENARVWLLPRRRIVPWRDVMRAVLVFRDLPMIAAAGEQLRSGLGADTGHARLDSPIVDTMPRPVLDEQGRLRTQLWSGPAELEARREAHGVSQARLAARISALAVSRRAKAASGASDAPTVGDASVRRWEGVPQQRLTHDLVWRLDRALEGDGSIGIEVRPLERLPGGAGAIKYGHTTYRMQVPDDWVGPLFWQLLPPREYCLGDHAGNALIRWGHYRRHINLDAIARWPLATEHAPCWVVSSRAALDSLPVDICVPPRWTVVAGMGAIPLAEDVNHRWRPELGQAFSLVADAVRAITASLSGR